MILLYAGDLSAAQTAGALSLDAPVSYTHLSPHQFGSDLKPLFDTILEHIAPPEGDENAPLGMLVSSVDYLSLIHI